MQYLGMFAGMLNKLGKIGVIVGFCLGNAILTYVANGNTIAVVTIREILIASLGLLLLPKNVNIDIADIVGKTKLLPVTGVVLEGDTKTVEKLNTVSETISEIAKSYQEVAATTAETEEELQEDAKKYFKEELLNNLEDFSDNLLYEDFVDMEDELLDSIYDVLEKDEEIDKDKLLKLLEDNNNYIIGLDNEGTKKTIEENLEQIVKTINHTYRINKLNLVWKQREASNKKTLANQLGGVSKVISSLADDIEDKEEKEEEKIQFNLKIASAKVTKSKSEVSGDTSIQTKLHDGKFMMAISDGMGSRTKS